MASEHLHAPRERLQPQTITVHQAIVSLMEELEAADWYQQRADDCDDPALRAVLLHNMREEIEHAAMILEWLRRHHPDFDHQFRTYLFSQGPITELEEEAEAGQTSDPAKVAEQHEQPPHGTAAPPLGRRFTIGPMK